MKKKENYKDPNRLAIYQKGKEIYYLVFKITELFDTDNDDLRFIKRDLIHNASLLSVKVAGVCNIELYDLKMEAATIIRRAANDLFVQYHSLRMFGFEEAEYFLIVRELINEYRLLFIEWVKTFDPWDYSIDRWGLFNPPGVGPFDHDPDDDIPFDL